MRWPSRLFPLGSSITTLKIPSALQRETLHGFYLLGLSVPVVILSAGLRGLLEAHQRFDLVTALRIPTGVFTFAGVLYWSFPFRATSYRWLRFSSQGGPRVAWHFAVALFQSPA